MKRNRLLTRFARTAALLLCAVLLFGSSACGRTAPAATPSPVPTQQVLPAMEQRRVLEENRALWAFPEEDVYYDPWFYTFTDLDHNGQMEVLAASTQGSGIFTYARFYELLADGSGVRNLYHADMDIEGPDDWPEIIRESLPCYYDRAADRYYYICQNDVRDGAAHSMSQWAALCLKDGIADWEYLAAKDVQWTEAGETVTCTDAAGNPISEQDYDSAVERRFTGLERSELRLNWTAVYPPEQAYVPETEPEPSPISVPEPVPTAAPEAVPVQSGPQVVVTKNPTSEALAVGGKTWFVAHATDALSLTWEIVDPQGNVYSLADAMSRHPGLSLEALQGDTLAVSNVPQSLNGWGARARFDGRGGTAYSTTATIYVDDYARAYASVIEAYKVAYTSGNRTAQFAFDNDMSEYIVGSSHVGYALKDLDKDGTPELIIADADGAEGESGYIVFDLYTLYNGLPVQLAVSQARNRWFLRSDSLLYNEASGGAAYSYRSLYRKTGTELSGMRSAFTWPNDAGSVDYYFQEGTVAFEPCSGDVKLSEAEFGAKVDELQGTFFLPQMTRIA